MFCRVRCDIHKPYRRLVEDRGVRFVLREVCRTLVDALRVRFDYHKVCRSLVNVRIVNVGGL